VLSIEHGRSISSVRPLPPPSELVQAIKDHFPDHFKEIEQTELLSCGFGALGHPYAILGLSPNQGLDWNVVFFAAGEFGWELVAHTNLESQRRYIPKALYVRGVPGALALTHVEGWGTGLFRRSTSWYRIALGEPIPLLTYPYYFHVVGWGLLFTRKLTSMLLETPAELTEGALLKLRFEIEYGMIDEFAEDGRDSHLFSTAEVLSLEWSETVQMFGPHTARDDFAKIDDFWNESTEEFVKRNISRLQDLAMVGTAQQQQFIKKHLLP
jgi:hypothetical protein